MHDISGTLLSFTKMSSKLTTALWNDTCIVAMLQIKALSQRSLGYFPDHTASMGWNHVLSIDSWDWAPVISVYL